MFHDFKTEIKGLLILAFMALFLLLVGFVVLEFVQVASTPRQPLQPVQTPTAREEPTAFVNWNVYRNDEFEFEIQYPLDTFQNISTTSREIDVLFFGAMRVLLESELFDSTADVYIPAFSITYSPLAVEAFREKEIEYSTHFGYSIPVFTAISGKGLGGYRFESGALNMGVLCASEQAILEAPSGGTLNLRYPECVKSDSGRELSKDRKQIFDQILSTLRFTPTP